MLGFMLVEGEPNLEFLANILQEHADGIVVIPNSPDWLPVLREAASGRSVDQTSRFAFELSETIPRLQESPLPSGFDGRWLDYEQLLVAADSIDSHLLDQAYWNRDSWNAYGMAYGILQGDKYVSAASSFAAGVNIHEIEVATHEDFRGRGLATLAAQRFVNRCNETQRWASWDAVNMQSKRIAERLGFAFTHEYPVLKIGPKAK